MTTSFTAPLGALALTLLLAATNAAAMSMDSQGEVSYITGGIGRDEVQTIKSEQARYPLGMEFTEATPKRNRYIADVEVTLTDSQGATVLEVKTEGPFLLVDLPAGNYEASATYNGVTQTKSLAIGGKPLRSIWVWQATDAMDEPNRAPNEQN